MTGITLGLDISAGGSLAPVPDQAAPAADITATLTPAAAPLYDGQSVGDMPGYAQMTDPGNFSSTAGTIAAAVVSFAGDATAADQPLAEGALAGFSVTVTDSLGNQRVFAAAPITVEYRARVLATTGNEAEIEINPRVPDGEVVELTIANAPYSGSYSELAGNIRNNANLFEGTIGVTSDGDPGLPRIGDTLTADPGLWSTPTGTLSLSTRWQSDGTDIPGATAASYTITADVAGTTVTPVVTGNDGTHAPVEADGPATEVPAAQGDPLAGALVGTANTFTQSGATMSSPLNMTAGQTGQALRIGIAVVSPVASIASAKLVNGSGAEQSLALVRAEQGSRVRLCVFRGAIPIDTAPTLVVTLSADVNATALMAAAYAVPGAANDTAASTATNGTAAASLGLGVSAGGVALAFAAEDRATGGVTLAGVDNQTTTVSAEAPADTFVHGFTNIATDEAARSFSATLAGNGYAALVALNVT